MGDKTNKQTNWTLPFLWREPIELATRGEGGWEDRSRRGAALAVTILRVAAVLRIDLKRPRRFLVDERRDALRFAHTRQPPDRRLLDPLVIVPWNFPVPFRPAFCCARGSRIWWTPPADGMPFIWWSSYARFALEMGNRSVAASCFFFWPSYSRRSLFVGGNEKLPDSTSRKRYLG